MEQFDTLISCLTVEEMLMYTAEVGLCYACCASL